MGEQVKLFKYVWNILKKSTFVIRKPTLFIRERMFAIRKLTFVIRTHTFHHKTHLLRQKTIFIRSSLLFSSGNVILIRKPYMFFHKRFSSDSQLLLIIKTQSASSETLFIHWDLLMVFHCDKIRHRAARHQWSVSNALLGSQSWDLWTPALGS